MKRMWVNPQITMKSEYGAYHTKYRKYLNREIGGYIFRHKHKLTKQIDEQRKSRIH